MFDENRDEFFQEKLEEIFIEKDIRFAGFIDLEGNLIKGKFREGIIPFEKDEEQRKIWNVQKKVHWRINGCCRWSDNRT